MTSVAVMGKWLVLGCFLSGCGGGTLAIAPAAPSASPDDGGALVESSPDSGSSVATDPYGAGCASGGRTCSFNGENQGLCVDGDCVPDCWSGLNPAWIVAIPNSGAAWVSGPYVDPLGDLYVEVDGGWERLTATGQLQPLPPSFDASELAHGGSSAVASNGSDYSLSSDQQTLCAASPGADGCTCAPVPPSGIDAGFYVEHQGAILAPGQGDLFTLSDALAGTSAICFPESARDTTLTRWSPELHEMWSCPLMGLNTAPAGIVVGSGQVVVLLLDESAYACDTTPNNAQLVGFEMPGQQPASDHQPLTSAVCQRPR